MNGTFIASLRITDYNDYIPYSIVSCNMGLLFRFVPYLMFYSDYKNVINEFYVNAMVVKKNGS